MTVHVRPNPVASVVVLATDPAVRHSLQFRLEVDGYDVKTVAPEGIGDIEMAEASCVILDHAPPGINADMMLAHWRERGIDCPVVLLASDPASAETRRMAAWTDVQTVDKPVLGDRLHEAVMHAMKHSGQAAMPVAVLSQPAG